MIRCTRCGVVTASPRRAPFGAYCMLCWAWLDRLRGMAQAVRARRERERHG